MKRYKFWNNKLLVSYEIAANSMSDAYTLLPEDTHSWHVAYKGSTELERGIISKTESKHIELPYDNNSL